MASEEKSGFKVKRISSWSIMRVLQTQEVTRGRGCLWGLIIYSTKRKIRESFKVFNFYIKALKLATGNDTLEALM